MSNKRVLIIDGNFMMKRILRDYTFMIDPAKDRQGFLVDLSQHFAAEMERVKGFCDHVIMCRDHHSWRKEVPQVRQLRLDTMSKIIAGDATAVADYKQNRKESSDRDWKLIYDTFDEFCNTLQDKFDVPVIHTYGAEGDDAIWACSAYYRRKKIKTAIYCSDSDLSQLVTPSCVVLRRIKSKFAPEGEVVVHPKFWELYNAPAEGGLAAFSYDPTKWQTEKEMLSGKSLDSGIVICRPFWDVLVHMICGSAKDNVFEIFCWPAKSITRHINVSHIKEALSVMGLKPTDITEELLYDEAFLKTLIINLCYSTGQFQFVEHLEHLYQHVCSNRKMNYLSEKEIPKQVQVDLFNLIDYQSLMESDMKRLCQWTLISEALGVSGDKTFQKLGI